MHTLGDGVSLVGEVLHRATHDHDDWWSESQGFTHAVLEEAIRV